MKTYLAEVLGTFLLVFIGTASVATGGFLADLPLGTLQTLDPRITSAVYEVLTPQASVASRKSYGGTAPDQVRAQIKRWKELLA